MSGIIVAIAHRSTDGEPMVEIQEGTLIPGRGLDTENRKPGKREVAFLSKQSWADACRELGTELPWYARRANVLVDGVDLAGARGKTLCIGDIRILLHGETRPCNIMDEQLQGLRRALEPDCRGGVTGQVLTGGVIRVGDEVRVI